jgi:transcriptional regulator
MHPAPIFQHGFDAAREIASAHPFAVLTAWSGTRLATVQAPLIEVLDSNRKLIGFEGHLARSNRFMAELDTKQTLPVSAVFLGPNTYVTPNSYPSKVDHGREVPTWNYLVAELEGELSFAGSSDETLAILDRQSNQFEQHEARPWSLVEAPKDYIDRLLGAIIGFSVSIDRFEATRKLNQNKSDKDFKGAANWLAAQPNPDARAIAAHMNALNGD